MTAIAKRTLAWLALCLIGFIVSASLVLVTTARVPRTVSENPSRGWAWSRVPDSEWGLRLYQALPAERQATVTVAEEVVRLCREARCVEAEALARSALEETGRRCGPDHPDVASHLTILAGVLGNQFKREAARPLCERALAITEKSLGPDHIATAISLNNLAMIDRSETDIELSKRALAIHEKVLGPDHPATAQALFDLAIISQDNSEWEAADQLFARALAIYDKAAGPDHPDTALFLYFWSWQYSSPAPPGDDGQAEELAKRAIAISEQAFGPDHSETARSLVCLANRYEEAASGPNRDRPPDYGKVVPLYERALAIWTKAPSGAPIQALLTQISLAHIYRSQGRDDKAAPLFERAIAMSEKAMGPDSSYTIEILEDLASTYDTQGRPDKAEPLRTRAAAIKQKQVATPDLDKSVPGNDSK